MGHGSFGGEPARVHSQIRGIRLTQAGTQISGPGVRLPSIRRGSRLSKIRSGAGGFASSGGLLDMTPFLCPAQYHGGYGSLALTSIA